MDENNQTCYKLIKFYFSGVNAGNLGVLAFKGTIYNIAEKFLETSVDMLDMYYSMASDDQKVSFLQN